MRNKYHAFLGSVIILSLFANTSWSQTLIEEPTIPLPDSVHSIMPCEGVISDKCLVGFIEGKQGKGGRFKLLDKSGTVLLERSVPRFREGWVRSDGDVVLVEQNEQGKGFSVKRLTLSGKEKGGISIPLGEHVSEEFDYNAAGKGDLFAVNVDSVMYLDGSVRMRPKSWKESVMLPLYWYLLPDASIIVSSGRSRDGGKEESARIDINGKILWKYPGSLALPNHVESRTIQMPKYLFLWGPENKSLSLVSVDTGELYWKVIESSDSFGVTFTAMSPAQNYLALSVATGRPKINLVIADIQKKAIIARKKLPIGLNQVVFDYSESRVYMSRQIWSRPSYRLDIIQRKQKVPVKIITEVLGVDLQEKAQAFEYDVDADRLDGEHLFLLPDSKIGLIDPFSNKVRRIKSHE